MGAWIWATDLATSPGMTQTLVIGVLAAVGGGAVAALVGGMFARPKTRAEVGKLVAEEGRTIDQRWKEWANELESKLSQERESHKTELTEVRSRLDTVEHALNESRGQVEALEATLREARKEVDTLQSALRHERALSRSLLGWAMAMREEVRRLGGEVPEMPYDVEGFLSGLDGPVNRPADPG